MRLKQDAISQNMSGVGGEGNKLSLSAQNPVLGSDDHMLYMREFISL